MKIQEIRGRHSPEQKTSENCDKQSKNKENRNKILVIGLLFIMLIIIAVIFIQMNSLDKINIIEEPDHIQYENNINTNLTNETKQPEIIDIDMPETMGDYRVIGKLVIDDIEFDEYILHTSTEEALKLSIARYYGPQPNKIGNFCIAGHNNKKEFNKLKKLSINDTFYIIDKETLQKVTYKIYDIKKVQPTNLDCLNQETNGTREVTLITCNPRRIN